MSRHISPSEAETLLRRAYQAATVSTTDEKWLRITSEVWQFDSKTFTAALGAILLAKAVDPGVDVGTIKVLPDAVNPNTFSLRTLCHNVLVPLSKELGFSIRSTGREPLNNQPFFRYAHVNEIDRVKNPIDLERYKSILYEDLAPLDSEQASSALASFIRVGIDQAAHIQRLATAEGHLSLAEARAGINNLLYSGNAGPWVVQALGAVFLEAFSEKIVTRRLNDPSRNFPGDVQGLLTSGDPFIALEARNKPVSISDARAFAEACSLHGINQAVMLELTGAPTQVSGFQILADIWDDYGVALTVIDSVETLLVTASSLGLVASDRFYAHLGGALGRYLSMIEAPERCRLAWADFVASHAGTLED